MSKLEVDKIDPQSGTDLELGTSGDTITIPAGVTFDSSAATNSLPANVVTTDGTQTLTNKNIVASQLTGTVATSNLGTGTADATTFLRGDQTYAAAGSPSIDDNGNATAITIDSNENVGIGTSGGNKQLTLESSGSNCGIRINNSVTGRPVAIGFDDSNNLTIWNNSTNGNILFYNQTGSGSERMRINNAGKIFTNQTAQFMNCVTIGGSPFTGDFQIEVSGLLAVNGGSWKQIGMRLSYAGIQDDAGGPQTKDVLITIRGLSSYNSVTGIDTGGGTVGITLNSSTTTASTFTITSPSSTCVGAYAVTLFANDNSTMECNA